MSAAAGRVRFLPPIAAQVLQGLCQHQLLSTRQIHVLHMPGVSLRYTQRILAELHQAALTERIPAPHGAALWCPTPDGRSLARCTNSHELPSRHRGALRPPAGLSRPHILEINETGIAFVNTARTRQDECNALSWHHDVAHPITPTRPHHKDQLVTAALLTYVEIHKGTAIPHQRFIELDRGTLPTEQLAEKLAAYKLLHNHGSQTTGQPTGWRSLYRTFPWVLVVLAAQHPATTERRIQNLTALWHTDPATQHLPTIPMHFVTLDQLTRHGPYAPIFTSANEPEHPQNWLGETGDQ